MQAHEPTPVARCCDKQQGAKRPPKGGQRGRLIAVMIAVANRDGCAGVSVSDVTSEAGISKPTFYDHFVDSDECLVAALVEVQAELLEVAVAQIGEAGPERAAQAAAAAMIAFAASQPSRARFLLGEAMAGGQRALDARDRGVAQMASAVDTASAGADGDQAFPDMPSGLLVGAVYRLLSSRLRRGEPAISELLEPVLAWLDSYTVPAGARRWQSLGPPPRPPRTGAEPRLRAPEALGRGSVKRRDRRRIPSTLEQDLGLTQRS